jgi:beta-N-acetylhexosaminidase
MMAMLPAIFGLSGPQLTSEERAFFRDSNPAGYILFGRNIVDHEQVRALTDSLRALSGRDNVPVLIDQEGGRVARLRAPNWPEFPAGAAFDALYERAPASAIEAARVNARALAVMLAACGINVDCLPLLDVRQPGASDVIGDRALGSEPMRVAALGRAILSGLQAGGVVGVVKHMPGHGRALLDTHKALPVVDASDADLASDLAPFAALRDAPMGMTCHVVFSAWDAELPATLSPTVIKTIIRERIGFNGLLMTDDLDMDALAGDVPSRAAAAVAAGCDIALNCWGKMDDMIGIAAALPAMSAEVRARLDGAMERVSETSAGPDFAALIDRRDALMAAAA